MKIQTIPVTLDNIIKKRECGVKDKMLSVRVTNKELIIYKELSKKYDMPFIIRDLIKELADREDVNDSI